MTAPTPANKLRMIRGLYRSLLRASAPFTAPSRTAVVLQCLLDRVGPWDYYMDFQNDKDDPLRLLSDSDTDSDTDSDDEDDSDEEEEEPDEHDLLFGKLLREAISGSPTGTRQMQFPQHFRRHDPDDVDDDDDGESSTTTATTTTYDTLRIRRLIQREFRNACTDFSQAARQRVAFTTLRCLNEKAQYYQDLKATIATPIHPQQAAWNVQPLTATAEAAASYLQPGVFLLAHPKLTGYFRRTVICLLNHHPNTGTYGLIVNRIFPNSNSINNKNQQQQQQQQQHRPRQHMTLQETFSNLPDDFLQAFGECIVKDGGPVHASLQMMHSVAPDVQEQLQLGGHVLSMANVGGRREQPPMQEPTTTQQQQQEDATTTTGATTNNVTSNIIPPAFTTDHAICFAGDIRNAAQATITGRLDAAKEVSFWAGSSGWSPGQLENEIEQGIWLPCWGPPELAFRGKCQYKYDDDDNGSVVGHKNGSTDTIIDSTVVKGSQQHQQSTSKEEEKSLPSSNNTNSNTPRRHDDLWLSMLSACSKEDAILAHLLWKDNGEHPLGGPCDK